ncbi:MAG: L,D-transpeptidase [Bacilli bacterium]|nr:L,D-transpeptidase [Bacilli bacterium]
MKIYSKKILTFLLTSSIALTTTNCAVIKEMEKQGLSVTEKKHYINSIDETLEVKQEDPIIMVQTLAVRAIDDAELMLNNEIVGYLPKDEELKVSSKYSDYYEVYYNDSIVCINSSDVIEDVITTTDSLYTKVVYIKEDASLYVDTKESIETKKISKYESAYVYKELDDYYYVLADNNIGYIKKDKTVELDGTYVIVDISSQHLDLYQNNEIVMTSPVVTGKDKVTPTTIGIHEIYDTRGNRDLIGENGARHYVDVMNKFYQNEGLHDAEYHTHYDDNGNILKKHGWRDISEFGGYTFLKHGSNGCVNMPHDKAIELDSYVDIGTKVLIKR